MECRLLALPPEIREIIYALAVVEDNSIPLIRGYPFIYEPGLLATSRQIRTEAMPIFYGDNIFKARDYYQTVDLIRFTNKQKFSLIKSIQAFSEEDPKGYSSSAWLDCLRYWTSNLPRLLSNGMPIKALLYPVAVGEAKEIVWARYEELDEFVNVMGEGKNYCIRKERSGLDVPEKLPRDVSALSL